MPFRLAFVPGVTPDKWRRIWEQRVPGVPLELTAIAVEDQLAVLHEGRADMCFVRLPVEREGLSLIPLYVEVPVVVVPREHVVTAFEEVSVADLADEHL
ncbi:MAG: LysR substrate-binding domain-containing protein, partial [Nocardioidaceae bacterium]